MIFYPNPPPAPEQSVSRTSEKGRSFYLLVSLILFLQLHVNPYTSYLSSQRSGLLASSLSFWNPFWSSLQGYLFCSFKFHAKLSFENFYHCIEIFSWKQFLGRDWAVNSQSPILVEESMRWSGDKSWGGNEILSLASTTIFPPPC